MIAFKNKLLFIGVLLIGCKTNTTLLMQSEVNSHLNEKERFSNYVSLQSIKNNSFDDFNLDFAYFFKETLDNIYLISIEHLINGISSDSSLLNTCKKNIPQLSMLPFPSQTYIGDNKNKIQKTLNFANHILSLNLDQKQNLYNAILLNLDLKNKLNFKKLNQFINVIDTQFCFAKKGFRSFQAIANEIEKKISSSTNQENINKNYISNEYQGCYGEVIIRMQIGILAFMYSCYKFFTTSEFANINILLNLIKFPYYPCMIYELKSNYDYSKVFHELTKYFSEHLNKFFKNEALVFNLCLFPNSLEDYKVEFEVIKDRPNNSNLTATKKKFEKTTEYEKIIKNSSKILFLENCNKYISQYKISNYNNMSVIACKNTDSPICTIFYSLIIDKSKIPLTPISTFSLFPYLFSCKGYFPSENSKNIFKVFPEIKEKIDIPFLYQAWNIKHFEMIFDIYKNKLNFNDNIHSLMNNNEILEHIKVSSRGSMIRYKFFYSFLIQCYIKHLIQYKNTFPVEIIDIILMFYKNI